MDTPWWVSNDDLFPIPVKKSLVSAVYSPDNHEEECFSGQGNCVPCNENGLFMDYGIRPVLKILSKSLSGFALDKIYIFGKNPDNNKLYVRWVYIGNGLLLSYDVLDTCSYCYDKWRESNKYDLSEAKDRVALIAEKIFTEEEIASISDGSFPERIAPYDGILVINADDSEIPTGAYCGNDYIKKVVIEKRTDPLKIGDLAFAYTPCESVEGLEYCTEIGAGAFLNAKLSGIIKLGDVAFVRDTAFEGNHLTGIDLTDFIGGIGASSFKENDIMSVMLGKGIIGIEECAFEGNCLDDDEIKKIEDAVMVYYDETAFMNQNHPF